MKIIILKGGLGNQLFQVSYAYYLAKKQEQQVVLLTGLLGSYQARRAFYFSTYFGNSKDNVKVKSSYVLAYLLRVCAFILEPIFPRLIFMESSKKYSKEKHLNSARVIDAYLQSFNDPDYFHFLLHDKTFSKFITTSLNPYFEPWYKNVIPKTKCLHIRGTDLKYLFDETQLKIEIKQILTSLVKTGVNDPVTIVTDDIAYAKSLLETVEKVELQSENWEIDFLTLAQARFMGLIDSTFSIWAGLYGLVVFKGNTLVASANCIQKYPLLTYLHQQQKIKSLEEIEWK